MSSNSKRRKKQNVKQRKDIRDRLTILPNSLKTKILSSLPTKDVVATSILSKEWKRSWTSVTSLDFDDNLDYDEDFINFVNRVLLLHDRSCLQTFRMKCSKKCRGSLINAWIAAVLLSNIKEIDLSVELDDAICCKPCTNSFHLFPDRFLSKTSTSPFHLPRETFLCKTLVVLKLDSRCYVNIPASVSLPCLKTLHIKDVVFSDDVSIVNLFSGCPVLEELQLSRCIRFSDDMCISIIVPSLTSLTIDYLPSSYHDFAGDYAYQVVIDTPSLRHLNFSDYSIGGYTLKNLNHFIKAEIDVGLREYSEEEFTNEFVELHSKRIADLFIGVSQVQSLVLSCVSIRMIFWCDVEFPTFSNLTCLELDISVEYLTQMFLENTLCVEPLYIRKGTPYTINEWEQREYERYLSIDDMPPSFLSQLKEIKINGLSGFKYEMPMVEYILKNAKVLEKLTLKYRSFHLGDAKKLLMLPRSSPICKVEIL